MRSRHLPRLHSKRWRLPWGSTHFRSQPNHRKHYVLGWPAIDFMISILSTSPPQFIIYFNSATIKNIDEKLALYKLHRVHLQKLPKGQWIQSRRSSLYFSVQFRFESKLNLSAIIVYLWIYMPNDGVTIGNSICVIYSIFGHSIENGQDSRIDSKKKKYMKQWKNNCNLG